MGTIALLPTSRVILGYSPYVFLETQKKFHETNFPYMCHSGVDNICVGNYVEKILPLKATRDGRCSVDLPRWLYILTLGNSEA